MGLALVYLGRQGVRVRADVNSDIIRMLLVSVFQMMLVASVLQVRERTLMDNVFVMTEPSPHVTEEDGALTEAYPLAMRIMDVNMESARMVGVRLLQRIIVGA